METNLREAHSNVEIIGKVSEISLKRDRDPEKGNVISGYLMIKTSDTNFIRVKVYATEFKNDGDYSRVYPSVETILQDYKSIADYGEEEADVIKTNAQISPYTNPESRNTTIGYKSNFFNRITGDYEPISDFEIEGFVKSVVPEIGKDGEETGRVKINIWMPTYNGIEPVELFVEENTADEALNYFEPGNTYNFWGEVNATQKKEERIISGGFGKEKKEVKTIFKNELICTGGSDAYEEDTPTPPYDSDAIKLAIQQREDRLNSGGTKSEKKKSRPSGSASGRNLPF